MNEGMCVVYFELCFMIGYVVKWCTFMAYNNNNITWCYQLYVFIIITNYTFLPVVICIYIVLHYSMLELQYLCFTNS